MNRSHALVLGLSLAAFSPACHTTAGKSALSPLTVVRDVVDAPLVSLTNVFEYWAEGSSKIPTASAGVGVTPSGISPGFFLNLNYWLFKPISLVLGSVDYVLCRSLYPNWPYGISPWRRTDESWGSLYFPNTRALWDEGEPELETAPYER